MRKANGLGVTLRNLRVRAELSQADVGVMFGLEGETVARCECGTSPKTTWMLIEALLFVLGEGPYPAELYAKLYPDERPTEQEIRARHGAA